MRGDRERQAMLEEDKGGGHSDTHLHSWWSNTSFASFSFLKGCRIGSLAIGRWVSEADRALSDPRLEMWGRGEPPT